jgi:hypothetical protein
MMRLSQNNEQPLFRLIISKTEALKPLRFRNYQLKIILIEIF